MKRIILISFMLISVCALKAQQQLSYAYDAAGNRVSRTIVLDTRGANVAANQTDSVFFEDMLAEKKIKLYPNPVENELTISITGYEPSWKGEYALFNMSGAMLSHKRLAGETTPVNMGQYLPGTYLLTIIIDGEKSVWKIIKQ